MADVLKPEVLRQYAVYWPPGDPSDTGTVTFGRPVEIRCRWTDQAVEFMDARGNASTSKSTVMVDRDVEPDGVLRLGRMSSVPDLAAAPFENTEAWRVKQFDKIPDRTATKFLRKAYL